MIWPEMDSADHRLECCLPEWYEQFMGTRLAFGEPRSVQKVNRDLVDCPFNPRRRQRQRKGQTPVSAKPQRAPAAAVSEPQRAPAAAVSGPQRAPAAAVSEPQRAPAAAVSGTQRAPAAAVSGSQRAPGPAAAVSEPQQVPVPAAVSAGQQMTPAPRVLSEVRSTQAARVWSAAWPTAVPRIRSAVRPTLYRAAASEPQGAPVPVPAASAPQLSPDPAASAATISGRRSYPRIRPPCCSGFQPLPPPCCRDLQFLPLQRPPVPATSDPQRAPVPAAPEPPQPPVPAAAATSSSSHRPRAAATSSSGRLRDATGSSSGHPRAAATSSSSRRRNLQSRRDLQFRPPRFPVPDPAGPPSESCSPEPRHLISLFSAPVSHTHLVSALLSPAHSAAVTHTLTARSFSCLPARLARPVPGFPRLPALPRPAGFPLLSRPWIPCYVPVSFH
ncbi:uncharacterized protein LOC142938492 [Anarhichas minor]|uniref:uncharacterized protein LOC142938492 n=1 Tax=Anarhichas minor TaxID=65739 RepID=UPI003F73D1FA